MKQLRLYARKNLADSRDRSGLGLVEVLIVIGIISLMGGVVLQTLNQYGWIRNTSRHQVNRAIKARAVFDEIRRTLRDLSHDDRRRTAASDSVTPDPLEVSDSPDDEYMNEVARTSFGLIGQEACIAVLIASGERPGARWMIYSTSRHNTCELPILSGSVGSDHRLAGEHPPDTLIRLSLLETVTGRIEDIFRTGNVDEDSLCAGVGEMRFHYFDGLEWHDQWDSRINKELPTAVRITVSLTDTVSAGGDVVRVSPAAADIFSTVIELTQR